MAIPRSKWGAQGFVPIDSTPKTELAIHHTVSSNRRWSPAEERAHCRQIDAGHRAQGFSTVGYSWLVFPSGRVYIGRGRQGLPAGQLNENSGTWALAFVLDGRSRGPSLQARRAARRIIRDLKDEGLRELGGHREFPNQSTECPGDKVLRYVRKWRSDFNLRRPTNAR